MARANSILHHANRHDIDAALAGGEGVRSVARRFDLSATAVSRYWQVHKNAPTSPPSSPPPSAHINRGASTPAPALPPEYRPATPDHPVQPVAPDDSYDPKIETLRLIMQWETMWVDRRVMAQRLGCSLSTIKRYLREAKRLKIKAIRDLEPEVAIADMLHAVRLEKAQAAQIQAMAKTRGDHKLALRAGARVTAATLAELEIRDRAGQLIRDITPRTPEHTGVSIGGLAIADMLHLVMDPAASDADLDRAFASTRQKYGYGGAAAPGEPDDDDLL